MTDSFPTDFYAASAGVIPLLFLTISLQSPYFEDYMKKLREMEEKYGNLDRYYEAHPSEFSTPNLRLISVFVITFSLFVVGVIGECVALASLLWHIDNTTTRLVVFMSVLQLLLLVAAVPIFPVLFPSFIKLRYRRRLNRFRRLREQEVSRDKEDSQSQ